MPLSFQTDAAVTKGIWGGKKKNHHHHPEAEACQLYLFCHYSEQPTKKSVIVCQACVRGLLDYVVPKKHRGGGDLGKALLTLFASDDRSNGGKHLASFLSSVSVNIPL